MVKIYWTFTYIPPFTISFTQTKTEQYCLLHNPKPDCNTFNTLPHITSLYYTLRLLLASFSPFFLLKWGAAPICWSNYTTRGMWNLLQGLLTKFNNSLFVAFTLTTENLFVVPLYYVGLLQFSIEFNLFAANSNLYL